MECSLCSNNQTIVMGKGLVSGYEPNRISLYLTYLWSDRLEDLERILLDDMAEYKINPNNNKGESNGK